MNTIYISNKSLSSIVEKFDTDKIDWHGNLKQSFEIESVFTNAWNNGEVDAEVTIDLIQTNNTLEIKSIEFNFTGFIAGDSEKVHIELEESYLHELEEQLKSELNG